MFTRICVRVYLHIHVHAYTCMFVYTYLHTYKCMYMDVFIYDGMYHNTLSLKGRSNVRKQGFARARSDLHSQIEAACMLLQFLSVCGESVCKFTARIVDHMHARRVLQGHHTRTHTYTHILHGHAGTTASLRIHRESVLAQAAVRCALLPVHLLGLCVFVCVCVSFVVRAFLCMCISV